MFSPDAFLGRLLTGVWRGVLAVVGMAVVLALLLLGFALSLALIVWALLRGRRPAPMRFQWRRAGQAWPDRSDRSSRPARASAEVVDVEVREITSSGKAPASPAAPDDRSFGP